MGFFICRYYSQSFDLTLALVALAPLRYQPGRLVPHGEAPRITVEEQTVLFFWLGAINPSFWHWQLKSRWLFEICQTRGVIVWDLPDRGVTIWEKYLNQDFSINGVRILTKAWTRRPSWVSLPIMQLFALLLSNIISVFLFTVLLVISWQAPCGKSQTTTLTSAVSAKYLDKLPWAKNHCLFSTRWANVYLDIKKKITDHKTQNN